MGCPPRIARVSARRARRRCAGARRDGRGWPRADRCGSASAIVDAWPFHAAHPHLRLVAAETPPGMEPEALADPFVTVGDRGGFSRVLLADVVGVGDAPLLRLVVKLQSDEYPFTARGRRVVTNPDVEAAWAREVDVLARCAPAAAGIPTPVEVLDRLPGEPALLPPTLYCKRRRAFFTAPCPTCGAALADLRDDRLLESLGLPRRDRSLARFLACAACGTGSAVGALPRAGHRAERRGRRRAGSVPRLRAAGAPGRRRAALPGLRARAHLLSGGGRGRVAASADTGHLLRVARHRAALRAPPVGRGDAAGGRPPRRLRWRSVPRPSPVARARSSDSCRVSRRSRRTSSRTTSPESSGSRCCA